MTSNTIDNNMNAAINPASSNADKIKTTAENSERDVKSTTQEQSGGKKAAAADQVLLTPFVQKLQEIEKTLAQQPEVNVDKVEQIKQKIANNEYSVNPDRIAEKLIGIDKLLK